MPTHLLRFASFLVGVLLLLFLIDLLRSSFSPVDDYALPLPDLLPQNYKYLQRGISTIYRPARQEQPHSSHNLHVDHRDLLLPFPSFIQHVDAPYVQQDEKHVYIDADGLIDFSEMEISPMLISCIQRLPQRSSIINMGRSYRKLLGTHSSRMLKDYLLSFDCRSLSEVEDMVSQHPDTDYADISATSSSSARIPAFLVSHPSFFLQLAIAFLLFALLALLLYFSMD